MGHLLDQLEPDRKKITSSLDGAILSPGLSAVKRSLTLDIKYQLRGPVINIFLMLAAPR
jgi:hypothetical protein